MTESDDAHVKGTGKWRMSGVPHKGWTCVDIEDLGEQCAICEMCEVQEIRYVHTMEHPNHSTLRTGCICAGHMEEDPVGARRREQDFKQRMSQRARWLRRRWRVSAKGNDFLNTQDGFNVVIFHTGGDLFWESWRARFIDKKTRYTRVSTRTFNSKQEAKLAVFDAIKSYKRKAMSNHTRDPESNE